jgi:hypothetical protein
MTEAIMNEQETPIVEDAGPKIYMDRDKIIYTFPGEEAFQIPIRHALHVGSDAERYTNGLLWFLNVQISTLVTAFQQAAARRGDPEKAAAAAMDQIKHMIPGFEKLLGDASGGVQARVAHALKGKGSS